jgi:phosphopentomutase
MGKFTVIVLDGFGIGAMPDIVQTRPQDMGANTCLHIFEKRPDLGLPVLGSLGLANILGTEMPHLKYSTTAIFGKAMLAHDGADTFWGHQEIMGTRPQKSYGEPIKNKLEVIVRTLREHGSRVRVHEGNREKMLIVEECLTVADNIECDPGQAFNVSAAIDDIEFDKVVEIGELVRSVSVVPRVVAFGGRGIHLQNLLAAVEEHGEYIGVNAPASGVYNDDYHCIHLGYGIDPEVQVPTILGNAGVPVFLLGKVADIVVNDHGVNIPMVDTRSVLEKTLTIVRETDTGFICANVQETDLSGHRENVDEYASKLETADEVIGKIIAELEQNDVLVVMADHGNDPTIGHPHHTREMAPLMIYSPASAPGSIGTRRTLSDVGASVADYFRSIRPQNGESFLPLLRGKR